MEDIFNKSCETVNIVLTFKATGIF
jgi:hypothetical protein